ncbi:MAG: hypothetical protein AB8G96_17245, partial [Phycisphaerales bacterium]
MLTHTRPRIAGALAALTLSIAATGSTLAQSSDRGADRPALPTLESASDTYRGIVESTFSVQNRLAQNIATELLSSFREYGEMTVAVDRSAKNAIVLKGPADVVRRAGTFIAAADRPADARVPEHAANVLRMYDVSGLREADLAHDIGHTLLMNHPDTRLIRGTSGRVISLLAPPSVQSAFTTAIAQIKEAERSGRPEVEEDSGPMLVRLTWLVASDDHDATSVSPPMEPVVRELESMGIIKWQQYGQSLVMTQAMVPFELESVFSAGGVNWDFDFNGIRQASLTRTVDGKPVDVERMSVAIQIRPLDDPTPRQVTNGRSLPRTSISTLLDMPAGQTVVLGMTPMLDQHSVFVVELLPA